MPEAEFSPIIPTLLRIIEWCLVPLILVIMLCYAFFFLPADTKPDEAKTAAYYGGWAGLVIFVLFVISRKGKSDNLTLAMPAYAFSWWLTSLGTIVGFFSSWIIDLIRHSRIVSFIVLALVASLSIALYSYFFIPGARVGILFLTLGFALGTLVNKAFGRLRPRA